VVGLPVLVGLSVVSSPLKLTGTLLLVLLLSLVGAPVGEASVVTLVGALVGVGGASVGALVGVGGASVDTLTGALVGAATGVLVGALVGVSGELLLEVLLLLESLMLFVLSLVSFSGSEALVGESVTGRCVGGFVGAWVGRLVLALQ